MGDLMFEVFRWNFGDCDLNRVLFERAGDSTMTKGKMASVDEYRWQ